MPNRRMPVRDPGGRRQQLGLEDVGVWRSGKDVWVCVKVCVCARVCACACACMYVHGHDDLTDYDL